MLLFLLRFYTINLMIPSLNYHIITYLVQSDLFRPKFGPSPTKIWTFPGPNGLKEKLKILETYVTMDC